MKNTRFLPYLVTLASDPWVGEAAASAIVEITFGQTSRSIENELRGIEDTKALKRIFFALENRINESKIRLISETPQSGNSGNRIDPASNFQSDSGDSR